jgi:HTH-type transcriptional regulator / antitoxin HipB
LEIRPIGPSSGDEGRNRTQFAKNPGREYFGEIVEIIPIGKMMSAIKTSADFGEQIRLRRKALGITQQQLAARCGVGVRFIVELEGGKPTCQLGKALTAAAEVRLLLLPPEIDQSDDLSSLDPNDPLAHIPRY